MKAYYSVLRLRLMLGLQYRSAAFAGMATQFFFGFMHIMVFIAFYAYSTQPTTMTLDEVVTYTWLKQAFLALIMLWYRDSELFQLITSGNVAYELCRPAGIYEFWYAKLMAQRISAALLRCAPILLVAFFLPEPYRLDLPESVPAFLLFVLTLALGLLVMVAISMLMYISVFVTLSPTGSLLLFGILGDFLAGMIIPIPLMPGPLQQVAELLPFHLIGDLPFRVYSGQIPVSQALISVLKQLVWLTALIGLGKVLLRHALRKVVIQGG